MMRCLPPLLLTLILSVCAGCKLEYHEVPGSSTWNNFPQDEKPTANAGNANTARSYGYTIELERYTGPNRGAQALENIQQLQREAGLTELWTQDDGARATVNYGRFRDQTQPDARTALSLVRNIVIEDKKPFKGVSLIAIERGQRVALNPHDLRQYSQTDNYYTLEVAIFTADTPRFRAAAEELAKKLRGEDEEAYFYHGPNTSSVTIGAMPSEVAFEWLDGREQYSQIVREIRTRFPHLQVNGQNPDADPTHPELGKEPTKLVRVPTF